MRKQLCPNDPSRDLTGFLAWHRGVFGDLRMEGDGTGAGDGGAAGDAGSGSSEGSGGSTDTGFPDATPVADMTAEQKAAYWRHHARRHEDASKAYRTAVGTLTPEQVAEKLAAFERLEQASQSESDRRVADTEKKARDEERAAFAPRLVLAEFRAAAKGVLTADQLEKLVEDRDLTKYLADNGDVNIDKIEKTVNAFAGSGSTSGAGGGKGPDLGQGQRKQQKLTGREAGLAEAQRRFGAKN